LGRALGAGAVGEWRWSKRAERRRRRRKVYSGANAVNEEDPERDRATQV